MYRFFLSSAVTVLRLLAKLLLVLTAHGTPEGCCKGAIAEVFLQF